MKIKILLSTFIFMSSLYSESNSSIVQEIKIDGELRILNYSRSATNSIIFSNAAGSAIGGNIGLHSALTEKLQANLRLYTTQVIPLINNDGLLPSSNVVDGTQGYTLLGIVNLSYDDTTNKVVVGRQALKTPLIQSDDARVVKDLFEAVFFETKVIKDTKLSMLYILSNSGQDNGVYASGISKADFTSMSSSLGTSYDEGIFAFGIENKSIKNFNAKVWFYDSSSTVKMLFSDANYKYTLNKNLDLKLESHFWHINSKSGYEQDTGKKIDYNYYGARLSGDFKKFTLQVAHDQIDYKDQTHGIHTAWGMYPEYTYGFLMGSGIYGAVNGINGEYVTKVYASKLTVIYPFAKKSQLMIGYNWYDANNEVLQSDMRLLDVLLAFPSKLLDGASWTFLYENWDSDGTNIMVDNHLIRAKFSYKFKV